MLSSLAFAWTAQGRCSLLNAAVTEVCFEVGYESLGSFSSKFRAQFGRSPAEFQREVRRIFGYSAPWRVLMMPGCFLQSLFFNSRLEPDDGASPA